MERYQPSNGSDGMAFMSEFCEQCMFDNSQKKVYCDVLNRTMIHDIKDEEYPKEWVYDGNFKPTCTKWKKWDWSINDNDPPQEEIIDPAQLGLF